MPTVGNNHTDTGCSFLTKPDWAVFCIANSKNVVYDVCKKIWLCRSEGLRSYVGSLVGEMGPFVISGVTLVHKTGVR